MRNHTLDQFHMHHMTILLSYLNGKLGRDIFKITIGNKCFYKSVMEMGSD
jgi:hypothetical protein